MAFLCEFKVSKLNSFLWAIKKKKRVAQLWAITFMRFWVCNSRIPAVPLWCEHSMPMSENLHNINIFQVNYSVKTHNCQVAEDAIYLEGVSKWKQMGLQAKILSTWSRPLVFRARSLSSWAGSRHPTGEVKFKLLGFQYSHHTVFWVRHWFKTEVVPLAWTKNWGRDE